MTRNRKNILIVRNDRFGEFLLNIPAIRAVKETFEESKVILAVDPYVKELAANVQYADEVIIWKNGKHSLFETIKFSDLLKKKNIDIALVMNPSKDSNIAVFLAGIPERIGYDHKWSFLLTKRKEDLKHLGQKHEVEYNLDLVKLAGVASVIARRREASIASPVIARLTKSAEAISKTGSQQAPQSLKTRLLRTHYRSASQ